MAFRPDEQQSPGFGAEPEVLGQLLAAHTLLARLRCTRTTLEFVAHALRLVPPVQASAAVLTADKLEVFDGEWGRLRGRLGECQIGRGAGYAWHSFPEGEVLVLDVGTLRQVYGCLYACCHNREGVAPYIPFLTNLAGSVALTLENQAQRRAVEETTAELLASKRDYELLFQGMTSGFATHEMIVDEQGNAVDYRILSVNQAFENLTGLEASEAVGRTAKEVLPGLEPEWIETFAEVVLRGKHLHFENYCASLGRHYEVIAYSTSPGKFATLFNDITERKQEEERLSRTAAEMEVAYRREHEMAEHLQQALLPEIRKVPGIEIDLTYRSASDHAQVGGDFYDLIPLPRGRVMIAVGDVCGKGVPAAKRMAAVRYTLRAMAADDFSPGVWLTEVNRRLAAMDEGTDFVTVALVVLDLAGKRLEYSLAGHPPPYLASPGGVRVLNRAAGLPLAVLAEGVYPVAEEALLPGDVLLLYTDGLSEARRGGTLFGSEELPAQASTVLGRPFVGEAERLVESAQHFSQGELRDDTVVVLLKIL